MLLENKVFEIPLNKKFHTIAESILGYNALSYTSLGTIYNPIKLLSLAFAIQISNTKKTLTHICI